MATFGKIALTGSTNGKGIPVSASASVGTTLHTAVSGTTSFDEVWLYGVNNSSSASTITIEFGGTATTDRIQVPVEAQAGLAVLVPGFFINNSLVVSAYSSIPNTITVFGYAHRVT